MEGTPFQMGGQSWIVPRLRVAAFEAAVKAIQEAEKIDAASDSFGLARLDVLCGGIAALLRENYPDLDAARVKEIVYTDEVAGLLAGLLKAGGKREGETEAPQMQPSSGASTGP